jgi:hypothetical protein
MPSFFLKILTTPGIYVTVFRSGTLSIYPNVTGAGENLWVRKTNEWGIIKMKERTPSLTYVI